MKYLINFGLALQIIVIIWMGSTIITNNTNLVLLIFYILHVIFAGVCFISIFKRSWNIAFPTSIANVALIIFLIIKAKYQLIEIIAFVPLVLYYVVLTTYASYKSKLNKYEKAVEKNLNNNDTKEI